MLLKKPRSGSTFKDTPWNVTHFFTLSPSAAIFLSLEPSTFTPLGSLKSKSIPMAVSEKEKKVTKGRKKLSVSDESRHKK